MNRPTLIGFKGISHGAKILLSPWYVLSPRWAILRPFISQASVAMTPSPPESVMMASLFPLGSTRNRSKNSFTFDSEDAAAIGAAYGSFVPP